MWRRSCTLSFSICCATRRTTSTGAEHPHTYAYLDIMDRWLKDHGMPPITRVYIKFIKPKQVAKASADPDDYDFEDEEDYINEDEPEQGEETEETK